MFSLEETPGCVAGAINLRGQVVPIVDLNRRFGHMPQSYRMEDCVVLLEQADRLIGIIVNEVRNVRGVAPSERFPVPVFGGDAPLDTRFVTGLIQSGSQIVMLLDAEKLLRLSEDISELPGGVETAQLEAADEFLRQATSQERAVFRERAAVLALPLDMGERAASTQVVVVRLGEEFFGIGLQVIQEFAELLRVTPIPCCPNHVVGLMNLRGNLITVLDISESLGLSVQVRADRKIVVMNSPQGQVGVLVDEVLQVLGLQAAELLPVLPANRAPGREYLQGTVPYGSKMLSLLDLPVLLMQQNLIVNESP